LTLSTKWSCRQIEVVDRLKLSTDWSCRQIEVVDKLKLSTNWSYWQIEVVDKLKLSTNWSYRQTEVVDKLKLSTNWNDGQNEKIDRMTILSTIFTFALFDLVSCRKKRNLLKKLELSPSKDFSRQKRKLFWEPIVLQGNLLIRFSKLFKPFLGQVFLVCRVTLKY